jgi:hypothetical protein
MTKTPTCTWDGENWTRPDGTPCNQDHCAMRGRCPNHVQHDAQLYTCPSCIRRTRRDIETIVLRATLLQLDVVVDGIDSEAMNLIGPAAAPQQYAEKRRRLEETYRRQGWCEWPRSEGYRPDDPHHPYVVLVRWAQALEETGWLASPPFHWTIARAAERITDNLDQIAQGDAFEAMAAELTRCRSHLDDVDHDSRTPDLGRPCPTCVEVHGKGPKLRKRHGTHPGMPAGKTCDRKNAGKPCDICDGRLDAWHCPNDPSHAWTDDEYRHRVDADYVQHARALTADQLADRFDLKAGTVRVWANRGLVRKRGRDQHGRQLYDVADVETRHAIARAS